MYHLYCCGAAPPFGVAVRTIVVPGTWGDAWEAVMVTAVSFAAGGGAGAGAGAGSGAGAGGGGAGAPPDGTGSGEPDTPPTFSTCTIGRFEYPSLSARIWET